MWLKFTLSARCASNMRVFSLRRDQLTLLDSSLRGRLSESLADVARNGGDPELRAERSRSPEGGPSIWVVIVEGGRLPVRFEVIDPRGLGVAAYVHLSDYIEELRNDVSSRIQEGQANEQLELDFCHPWSRRPAGDPS